jgi:hypothetical protein
MKTKDALKSTMDISSMVLDSYISDMSDAELMSRPSPSSNHLAWQLGHLISSEVSLLESICPGKAAELPAGFAEKHAKETVANDDPRQFCTKEEYRALFQKVRASTLAALEGLSDADLDAPSPERFRQFVPTVGQLLTLIGTHPMMHAGQFAVVRRVLGKPVLM